MLPGESTALGGVAAWDWAAQAAPEPSRVTSVTCALAECASRSGCPLSATPCTSPLLHALNPPRDELLDQTLLLSSNVCKNKAL